MEQEKKARDNKKYTTNGAYKKERRPRESGVSPESGEKVGDSGPEKTEKREATAKKVSPGKGKFAGNEKTEMLNTLVNNLYDIQKVRISVENRNRALQEKSKELIFNDHAVRLKKLERDTVKEIGVELSNFSISTWMTGQRGIGPSLAGQTIAILRDVGRFSNVSKLWSYSGMATMEVCMHCGKKVLRTPKREEWIVRVAKRLEEQHD